MQSGTSKPTWEAISITFFIEIFKWYFFFKIFKTDAASLEPPPKPDPCGIFFSTIILKKIFLRKPFALRIFNNLVMVLFFLFI